MIMETENEPGENTGEIFDAKKEESMAPQDTDEGGISDSEMGHNEQKENKDPMQMNSKFEGSYQGSELYDKKAEAMVSADDGEVDDAEDGEILEDGEIASDQEGEVAEEVEEEEGEEKSGSELSSPTKQRSSGHREDHKRRGHDKRDRHSKRRRTSKEDSHKDKQKKKRHKEHTDYDKSGEDYDSSWSDTKRDKSDRKKESPSHDSHGDDKRRRGSGESRHHRDRERGRDRDKTSTDKDKSRDRSRDKHDRGDKPDKKNRESRWSRDKDNKGRDVSDSYDSPPGIYDSPSDDEYDASRYAEKKPKFGEGEFMEMGNNFKGKKNKNKKFDRRRQKNERSEDFEEEAAPPVKKKPLLQTPMDERPVCRFFKEGKCQKGPECPFNHDYQPQKRFELCKFHLQSYCRKEDCVFMHEDFPCKYYHTGSTCYQGDNCKFSHDPLTPETEVALQTLMKEKEDWEEDYADRKHKKKGLLGDQPQMTEEEIQQKLETMKSIPSIFDIETHKPGESPNKPPSKMGQSPNIRPQGMSPQTGPNMRFNGPPNQMGSMNRPPFLGPAVPGMDGPPMGMQVPPPMVSGSMVSGAGLMGPGPNSMMAASGMPPPGMQGPPMGPPMSQAAALVGAILRAAPMFQQFRGPNQQGQNTTMPGDPRFMGPMMGPVPNMEAPNLMMPPPTLGPGGPIMSPSQDGMMGDNQGQPQQGMLGDQNQMMSPGQGHFMQGQDQGQQQQMPMQMNQSNPQIGQMNISGGGNVRDPRKSNAQNDPRLKKGGESESKDVDLRSSLEGDEKNMKNMNYGDEDFRQDVDFRHGESNSNQGDHTPQQDWSDENNDLNEEDMDIPSHLPPKQREMFMRIKQHSLKMQREKSAEQPKDLDQQQKEEPTVKMDDSWYSSDEEDDQKPNIKNIMSSLGSVEQHPQEPAKISTATSSINVMQMINAIKSSNPTPSANRPNDPRMQPKPAMPHREPANIQSREGDCPWRLCRVLYVKQRIPQNIDLNDTKYKTDPRVQKMLKMQELESGKVIDHTKTVLPVKNELHKSSSEHRLPELLDPKLFQEKQGSILKPELTPFVDPRMGVKTEKPDQNYKPEMPVPVQRPLDPRVKPVLDPRVQRLSSNPGIPARPMDPRLSRQDSNSSVSNSSAVNFGARPFDPRLARQDSQDSLSSSRGNTPPIDSRMFNRQSSLTDPPKITQLENLPSLPLDLGLDVSKSNDVHRQISQPGTSAEKDAAKDSSKPKLDYRNDPRFKRKRIAEAAASPDSSVKRFSGQRKSSTEYSSPLGGDSVPSPTEESGYNSYNRPRPAKPPVSLSQLQYTSVTKSETLPSSDLSTHDILDSLQIMPPPGMQEPPVADKNLKDIFKTIDPTASPFC